MTANISNNAYPRKCHAVERLKQMGEWTGRELEKIGEMRFRNLIYFTLPGNPIGPYQVWVNAIQLPVYENVYVTLSEV